ncbi:MAG: HYR domain-containing protein [Acidobacteriota bacterium]
MVVTPALRDIKPEILTPEQLAKIAREREIKKEKNASNVKRIRPEWDPKKTTNFLDRAINNAKDPQSTAVTNPIQNFDGPEADDLPALFGGRFAPPDTNAAVGPNHVVFATNSMIEVFNKTGTSLLGPVRISSLLVGIANATDDDGDPIVLYDSLADRWFISQFNLRFNASSQMHMHVAVSQTGDPTGAWYAYDFLTNAGRFVDYPHVGVWPDGYYMASNDFNTSGTAFLGAGCYVFERAKMLVGDPTAKIIGFNLPNTEGGMLPTNLQGFTAPPVNTPNLFIEFDADEFGAATDLIRVFEFRPNYTTPASSTLTQLSDIPVAAFDARNPSGRADIAQPAGGEGLDSIADRLMHALNFRVLSGGVQSYVFNWSVNVSGVTPTSSATYQAGIRWMELRRNAGTGALTINQEATYAPGSGSGTGRDLWMASVAQDGEGNIALAANASGTSPALNPTAIYTGRLAGDPANTLPQGEIDAFSAVTRGVQTATSNRWGDYSSLFVDPSDECTFWGAFEYVDSPTATFDWNTRAFSFKVNPTCVTAPRGTININVTNCVSGNPIAGAVATTADGFFRQTSAGGTASMTVSPGTYTITVTAPGGFSTCTQMVTVTAGGTATVNCCLAPSAIITSAGATIVTEGCTPANGAIDPGENVTVSLCVQNTGGLDTTNLVGTLQNTGGVTGAGAPQNYGVVVAGGPAVCRNFTFTASGTCGGTLTATLDLSDGATNLGTVTYTFTLGVLNTALSENFDGVTAPALPAGWVATENQDVAGNSNPWATQAATADTAPNSAFTNDPNNISDEWLDTPTLNLPAGPAVLTFRNNFDMENTFDGGVVEISINGGAFTDIITAGGSFVGGTQGYNGTISVNFSSPIAGRQAFTNTSSGYVTTGINLPASSQGQPVVIRFRRATDTSVADVGWRIDTITLTAGFTCCTTGGACTLTCPANVTQSNDTNQCGAVVNYPAPTTTGSCGTVTCTPPSGSFFPVGTTTVTCSESGGGAAPTGGGATCSFTVTINDTQPPSITCPANVTAVTPTPGAATAVVNYPPPTASDNCPGVTTACVPPSGSTFAVGVTTVTCTATDAAGNTATCTFTVALFNASLQDESAACNSSALFNTTNGAYRFCCDGTTFTGTGTVKKQGNVYTLTHNAPDRRVLLQIDGSTKKGNGSLQSPPGTLRCTIRDDNITNNTCLCGMPVMPVGSTPKK